MQIRFENVSYIYKIKTPFEKKALDRITCTIPSQSFTAVIGQTGSGKSTLIQLLNGLLRPTSGEVRIGEFVNQPKKEMRRKDRKEKDDLQVLRRKVGVVFQYPEHQLFEETVWDDVAYGLKNLQWPADRIAARVSEVLGLVGFDAEQAKRRSPFELSGGQMRRIAIAGVLAMHPEVLVLDEPTAGLDPQGKRQIIDLITALQREERLTVIMVSHSMEDVLKLADEVLVLHQGHVLIQSKPLALFRQSDLLVKAGLDVPESIAFIRRLRDQGYEIPEDLVQPEKIAAHLAGLLKKGAGSP
jgi:energy-coupling factor transport system ATP-binding protein